MKFHNCSKNILFIVVTFEFTFEFPIEFPISGFRLMTLHATFEFPVSCFRLIISIHIVVYGLLVTVAPCVCITELFKISPFTCISTLVLQAGLDELFNCPSMRESFEKLVAFSSLGAQVKGN